jgi:hypothetical protein
LIKQNCSSTAPLDPNFSVTDPALIRRILADSYAVKLGDGLELLQLFLAPLLTGQHLEFRGVRHREHDYLAMVFRDRCGMVEDIGLQTWTVDGKYTTLPASIVREIFGEEAA